MGFILAILALPIAVVITILVSRISDIKTLFKWLTAFAYIEISRWRNKRRFDLYNIHAHNEPEKVGYLPAKLEYELESPFSETHLLQASDEIFFYGVNAYSERLITRIARSVSDEAQAWLYLKLKNGRIYTLQETSCYQHGCSDTEREFTCGSLKMHYISPMRLWRIFYHGLLRETSEQDPSVDRMVYVKIALLWKASSDVFDMTTDINSTALATGLARSKWRSFTPPLKKLQDVMNMYCQGGVITGTVHVEGEAQDHILYLFGERMRFLGDSFLDKGTKFTHILGQISKTGCVVHVGERTMPGVVKNFRFGFVVLPNGVITSITDRNMFIEDVGDGQNENIKAVFHADGLRFELDANVVGREDNFESRKGWEGVFSTHELCLRMDSLDGSGVLIKGETTRPARRKTIQYSTIVIPEVIPPAVHFSEELCQASEVTGGKGSSLGKLTHLSKQFQTFIVPNGIVVTTSAYEAFVNQHILREIKSLEDVLYGKTSGDVKEACQKVMDEVMKASIPDKVQGEIIKCLQKAFGEKLQEKKFAVRSSATGEDTEQLSAAGQMETFLGIRGLNEIMSALKKCWASQFGFVAVNYKRQYGQIINSPMAVVIQEMVNCDVAGVLFTCDPLTGNPALMSITANYGLGESVVSASEEPDQITLKRDIDDKLEIQDKIIGSKKHRIVVKGEGTTVEEVSEDEMKSCCVSDENAMRLAKIALQIEKRYRSNRDIEWGFWNNNLYIFQSRPVTSGTGETDFEIDHETDVPLRIENDFFTVCNVGEVLPGATSPLGLDVWMKAFHTMLKRSTVIEWQPKVKPNYFNKFLGPIYNHCMFHTVDFLERVSEGRQVVDAQMVGFFGRVIEDEELFEVARMRYGRNKRQSLLLKYYRLLVGILTPARRLKRAKEDYAGYRIPVEKAKTSQELFDILIHSCTDINEAITCHMLATQASSLWNLSMISVLQRAKGGLSSDVYSDFSKLLSSINEVESAEVPAGMQNLAYLIGKELSPEKFKKMDFEEILQWLNNSSNEAGIAYRQFMKKHGHRCLKEFDIRSMMWEMDPKILIKLLQTFAGNVSREKSAKISESEKEILSSYNKELGFVFRMLLKILTPMCRRGVQCREGTKSLWIRINGEWRKGYRQLAKMMVAEGRIPDEDLMFFMTLEEIREILSNRSPMIIAKASHRRRRYPILDSYIFPEYMKGFPVPVNLDPSPIVATDENFSMKGIPVSQGVAKGYVRVALTLEEAALLKPGEILLTYSTDIGWTPYFPTLAGVVTELGGLISHGAVVSREYGLPCIAGLHGATRQFQTGDYVLLNGNTGVLQKISPPE